MTRTYLNVAIQGALFTAGALLAQSFYGDVRTYGLTGAINMAKTKIKTEVGKIAEVVGAKLKKVFGNKKLRVVLG